MRKIYLMMCLLAMSVAPSMAQRYLEEIFTDVEVTSNVVYGVNATVLYVPQVGQAVPEELKMDIYQPVGDTETNRPILLYFHSGNFLPFPFNGGTGGSKTDSATVEICTRFARMGYVVASCDYRMGWNPLAPTQPERTFTLINAAYRGVQDCRTAVRYMRKSVAEESNPFGVDSTRVAVWGQGTGGYIAFAAATLDNWQEDIAQIEKFNWDPTGSGMPVPMVVESVNGNADGTSYGVYLGDTLCYPNHVGYTSDFNVMVNMGGAMGEISWLENPSIPMISFHVPTDPFAPYQTGTVVVPTTGEQVVEVAGSYAVQEMANAFSSNAVFQLADNYEAGLPFTNAANQGNNGFYGLCPIFRTTAPPAYDSSPWDWWNADAIAAFDAANGTSNNANNLAQNPDMSATKARTFIDTIQGYAAPRIMCALNLPGSPCELISGCTAMEACNYNPDAAIEDFSCLFPGDPCDDGDPNTMGEIYDMMCGCSMPIAGCMAPMACNFNPEANIEDGTCYFPGEPCDDGDPNTMGEIWDSNCECSASAIGGCMNIAACNYDALATVDNGTCAYPADPCDDGNPNTTGEIYDADCLCSATAVAGCMDATACNYNSAATVEDGSCYSVGDSCDDGDANTVNDVYNSACECEGEVSVFEVETTFVVYPNPSEGLFTITNAQGVAANLIEVFDITGKRIAAMNPTSSSFTLDMTTMPRGMYTIKIQSANSIQTIRVQRI
jgi:poly(3-hydroxybutyrate) depolymerase